MIRRYSGAVAKAAGRCVQELSTSPVGFAVIIVPPGEQEAVADALLDTLEGFARGPLTAEVLASGPPLFLSTSLPSKSDQREQLLRNLNERREWTFRHGWFRLLLVDREQAGELTRHAPDTWSRVRWMDEVPFVADESM